MSILIFLFFDGAHSASFFFVYSCINFYHLNEIFIDLGIVIFKNKYTRNDLNVLSFYGTMKTLKFERR